MISMGQVGQAKLVHPRLFWWPKSYQINKYKFIP